MSPKFQTTANNLVAMKKVKTEYIAPQNRGGAVA